MDELRIGGTARERRIAFGSLVVSVVLTVGLVVWAVLAGSPLSGARGRILVTFLAAVLDVVCLYLGYVAAGVTIVDDWGVRTRSPLLRRRVPWTLIEGFELHQRSSRGGTMHLIRARLKDGACFVLPGTLLDGAEERESAARLRMIERRWAVARSRAAARGDEGPGVPG